MQSITRKQKRIESGLQNPVPSSTKLHPHTKAVKAGTFNCFRTGRFNANVPIFVRRSGKRVLVGFKLKNHEINSDPNGYVNPQQFATIQKKSFSSRMVNWFKKLANLLGFDKLRGVKLAYQ